MSGKKEVGTTTIKKRKRGRPTLGASINQEHILRESLKCFAEFGFGGAKINAISKRAKVDDSLLHYHFKSKENLWKKAVELGFQDYNQDAQTIIKLFKDMDVITWAKASIRHSVHYNAKHPELYQIIFHELTQKSDRSDWIINHVLKPMTKKIYLLHKNLKKENLVKDLPLPNLVSIYIGAINSFFILHNQMRQQFNIDVFSEEEIDRHADTVIEIIFSSILINTDRGN